MSITCPKCQQIVTSTDGYCQSCGFKINNVWSADNIKKVCKNTLCKKYNSEYGIDENYCGICGSELVLVSSVLEAEPPDLQKKKGYLRMPDGSEIEITPTQRLIGRIDLSKYVSEGDQDHISRGHATFSQVEGKFYVEDGKTIVQEKPSRNKTWLVSEGQKEEITEKGRHELKDGDEINIADTVTLIFTLK